METAFVGIAYYVNLVAGAAVDVSIAVCGVRTFLMNSTSLTF